MFLAKQGIKSLVIDKETFPRDKICGDALSGKVVEVLNKLDSGIVDRIASDQKHLGSWGVTFVAPNRKELRVPFKTKYNKLEDRPPGFIAKRVDFDNFMVEEARRYEEIEIREGVAASEYELHQDGWLLKAKDQKRKEPTTIKTKLLIDASGAQSKFSRTMGGISLQPNKYCAGIRSYYKGVKNLDGDNFIELQFLNDFLPGYFWIFPLPNGLCNVGVGMRSDKVAANKINLRKAMVELIENDPILKERFADAEQVDPPKGFGLPLGSKKWGISGNNFMLVGDAGSLIDPFTGEGIGNAMYSGLFAAEQAKKCLETESYSAKFMKQYDQAVYERLWPELKLSARMQSLVKYPWLFNLVVNKANKNKALSELISCMFEDLDLRKKLKNPAFYFNLMFANGN